MNTSLLSYVLSRQRRQWHPTPVFLPGKSHGWRSLVGCSPWGRLESDTTERLHLHALEKEMATHSSVLAWRIPGTGEPGGLPSMGLYRVGHDWSDLAAAAVLNRIWLSVTSLTRLPGSSVHEIIPVRTLKWVVISFSITVIRQDQAESDENWKNSFINPNMSVEQAFCDVYFSIRSPHLL